jgi:hypothetical protein
MQSFYGNTLRFPSLNILFIMMVSFCSKQTFSFYVFVAIKLDTDNV